MRDEHALLLGSGSVGFPVGSPSAAAATVVEQFSLRSAAGVAALATREVWVVVDAVAW